MSEQGTQPGVESGGDPRDEHPLAVLASGLDQVADLLGEVGEDDLERPTPCEQWTVGRLAAHLVSATGRFAAGVRGEQIDWSAPDEPVSGDLKRAFQGPADDLLAAWTEAGSVDPAWQLAELAVHTWDLATALGRTTEGLDPEVAEQGLAFMRAQLTPDRRGEAFGPEQEAPVDADAYGRIAAFAGRRA